MTGASGAPYAVGLLRALCRAGRTVHLTISPSGAQVLREELGLDVALDAVRPARRSATSAPAGWSTIITTTSRRGSPAGRS